jgi:hypothetical protein
MIRSYYLECEHHNDLRHAWQWLNASARRKKKEERLTEKIAAVTITLCAAARGNGDGRL